MQSSAKTVSEYISNLPENRREQIEQVRKVILNHLPKGYEEVMNWGMITYQVPLDRYPDTYNKKPLMYAALASQKNYMSLYLIGIYMHDSLRQQFEKKYKASGKKMNIGKSCVRFKTIEDLPLNLIGPAIAAFDVDDFIDHFIKETERARSQRKKR
jgi:hypothetical protein